MRLSTRQRAILRVLRDGDYVQVRDLAEHLEVDVSTIRRDLQDLVDGDLVLRLHGGVRLRRNEPASSLTPSARPASEDGRHRAIASTARRMLRDGDSLLLSAGPCTEALVPMLLDLQDMTIITNNLVAADRLSHHHQFRVLVAGGEIQDGDHGITSGAAAAEFIATQRARWVFLEIDGVHPFAGMTTATPWRVSVLRAMLAAAERRCILAPSSVFGSRCVGFISDLDQADLVITDEELADDALPAFAGRVVRGAIDPTDDWRDSESQRAPWRRY